MCKGRDPAALFELRWGLISPNHNLFDAGTPSTSAIKVRFRGTATGGYEVNGWAQNDGSATIDLGWHPISNNWHVIEVEWQAASGAGANNGFATLWIDGVPYTASGLDNDTRLIEQARLGPLYGIDTGTSGTEYFDAFAKHPVAERSGRVVAVGQELFWI